MTAALVVGGNRGIGLALVQELVCPSLCLYQSTLKSAGLQRLVKNSLRDNAEPFRLG